MGQRYAVDFTVEPGNAPDSTPGEARTEVRGAALLEQVAAAASGWLRGRKQLPRPDEPTGSWATDNGRITVQAERGGDTAVYRFEWTLTQAGSLWTIELQLSTSGDEVDLHATVHTDEADDADQDGVRFGLIGELVERFDCRRLGGRLQSESKRIAGADVDKFVADRLTLAERVPLVAVSVGRDGHALLHPDQLQLDLAGLANVYLLDAAASARLSERVGGSLSCYAGAVRLYAPGFTDSDRSWQHPFWLANQVRSKGRPAGQPVWREIAAQAAQMAVPSSPPVQFYIRQDAIRSVEIERLRAAVPDETLTEQDENLAEQVKTLQALVEQERRWREAVIGERDRFQNLYEQAQRSLDSQRSDAEREQSEQAREAGTVSEAVQIADTRRGEHLKFLNSAFESAERSNYPLPNQVLEALSGLNELGALLSADRLPVEQIVQWLNDHNLECSTESEDAMRRYGGERVFRDETGLEIPMPKHIKLGGGSGQDNVLRIHFEWMSDYGEILVGHVGRHLRTGRS